jgi:uncharacterized protein (DUF1697 family)
MPRYAAFLRGVMPTNAKMPELRRAFEAAGYTGVKTVLSSGNLVFDARKGREAALQDRAELAMSRELGRTFFTVVRPIEALQQILASDPYRGFDLSPSAKRIVTFLRDDPPEDLALPIEQDGAQLLALRGRELFSAYLPTPKGPVFMSLIERTLGKDVTTRTWDTVRKVATA